MTDQEMADELLLSISSVSRFWKAAGFKHAKDFKNRLRFRCWTIAYVICKKHAAI
ncbi:hypothetical protein [Paenibacillus pseudetheri]|uniref:hypothetical protein n=1 Tax=Paenibacillus pseudetheri TaxID=2897682 RepID=UPI001F4602C8|nr:hypothetical protein [Paenibacillus pseudetheri]